MNYAVFVTNIGQVYDGPDKATADHMFSTYQGQSKDNYGRVAGESVVMMVDGEPSYHFVGSLEKAAEDGIN